MSEIDLRNYTFSQLINIRDNYGDCDEDAIAELIDQKGEMLERELAASKADRVAISQKLSDALDALFASSKRLSEARVEIERLKFGRLTDEATKTPRTQAAIKTYGDYIRSEDAVPIEFAEQLETELADKDRQLAEITRQRNAYKKALEMAEDELMTVRAEIERLKATTIDASLLREKLAELAHNQWVGWMEYLFSKSKQVDGCVVIPAWANERWHRQVATRYADLSEEEKDSDRIEADKFLAVFNAQLAERDKLIEQMREALRLALPEARSTHVEQTILAALAAERHSK